MTIHLASLFASASVGAICGALITTAVLYLFLSKNDDSRRLPTVVVLAVLTAVFATSFLVGPLPRDWTYVGWGALGAALLVVGSGVAGSGLFHHAPAPEQAPAEAEHQGPAV